MQSNTLVKDLLQSRRAVFGFIYALTRDAETAEEIFQEVSLSVLEEASKQPQVASFLPWICGIARHRVADYYRSRQQREPVSPLLADAVASVFEQHEETREEAARRIRGLLDCVDELPARQREIVEQHYRHRRAIDQIATRIRWRPDAVKVALSKIRKSLADCLRGKSATEGLELP